MAEKKDYAETLFQSIQTLIDSSVSSLRYDRTITGTIVNNDARARGEYLVSDGASTFTAYSDITTYQNDASVYITVPEGDYNNKKIILGRRTSADSEYFNYVAPSETFVDITGDLKGAIAGSPFSILANGDTFLKKVYSITNTQKKYDRLCVKADFMNTLNRLETVSGDYGLYIKVKYTDEVDVNVSSEKTFNFSQNDMYGDVYNFTTYFSQEAVFDISDIGIIQSIEVYLYQGSNFKRVKSTADSKDNLELIPNKIKYTDIDNEDYTTEMEPNIFIDNIQVSLGYDLNNFKNDTVIVYTLNSTQYSSSDSSASRKREIRARWVHKTDDGFVSVPTTELTKYNANIYWYHYVLDEKASSDEFGGKYWVPIATTDNSNEQYLDANDAYKCYIVCDPAVQDENVKAVISIPSAEKLAYIEELKDYFKNDRNLFAEDEVSLIIDALEKYNVINGDDDVANALTNFRNKITNGDPNWEDNSQKEDQVDYLDKTINKINEMKENLSPYDLYSDVVQIHNTTQVQARLAVDLVQAVSISVGDENDPYKGVYMVYGENGEIMNSSLAVQRQKLVLSYGSLLTGLKEFDGDGSEIVSWRFPLTNTMIRQPTDGVEYDNNQTFEDSDGQTVQAIQYIDDDGNAESIEKATWAVIRRKIYSEETANGKIEIGGFEAKTTEQIFRIKDYYTSVGRNTIYCEISKGGYIYVAEITLIFGTAGTSGTDYTLRIIPSANGIVSNCSIKLDAQVYDFNNQKVDIINVKWTFISPDSLNKSINEKAETSVSFNKDKILNSLSVSSSQATIYYRGEDTSNYYGIIKAEATIQALGNTILIAYFPLSWSNNLTNYNHFEGPDKIVYNAQGTNPFYYKSNFVLYNNLDKPVNNLVWSIEVYKTDINTVSKFYPQIVVNDGLYSLKVPSMYIKENYLCRLIGKINDEVVWIQPLYISQNAYNSPLLNNWDGTVSIDNEQGTILAPMIGAGKKNNNNQFSGVLMGDVKKTDESIALTGLYGYQNGVQSFALTEDGKAKLGASGKGQIIIDGNSGIIKSGNYAVDKTTGMKINLEDGNIDAYNFKLTSKHITISSQEDEDNYFTIKGSGTYKSKTYTYNNENQQLSSITTADKTADKQTLINVGNNSYYLQTLNYSDANEEGMRWNLQNGKLNAYTGFKLTAVNHTVKVKGDGDDVADDSEANVETKDDSIYYKGILSINADAGQYPIKLQLGNETPFKLSWAGYLHTTKLQATGGTIGGWNINAKQLYTGDDSKSTASGAICLSSINFSRQVNGMNRDDLRLAIGGSFGIGNAGILYAQGAQLSNANISYGAIHRADITSASISNCNMTSMTLDGQSISYNTVKVLTGLNHTSWTPQSIRYIKSYDTATIFGKTVVTNINYGTLENVTTNLVMRYQTRSLGVLMASGESEGFA